MTSGLDYFNTLLYDLPELVNKADRVKVYILFPVDQVLITDNGKYVKDNLLLYLKVSCQHCGVQIRLPSL